MDVPVVQLSKITQPIQKAKPNINQILHNLYQLIEDASFIFIPAFAYLSVVHRIDTNHLNSGARVGVSLGCAALFIKFVRYLASKGV
jgi:hypothetical protein